MRGVLVNATAGVAAAAGMVVAVQAAQPADGAASAPAVPAAQVTSVQSVVVTAQRRTESAQDVGVAISVLSGEELQARGVDSVNKLQNEVPSLEVEPAFGSGQAQFRIRGIGFQDYGSNNASPVSVYLDDLSFAFPVQTQGLLFDLDRVEVLRGPQGTLYGKNTTGGAINFLARKPTKEFESWVSAGYGSHDASTVQGVISGSLSDSVRGRLSVAGEGGGAWQHNRDTGQKLGDKHILAARGQLEIDATRDLRINLSANLSKDKSDVQGLYLPTARPDYGFAADTNRNATGWGLAPGFAQLIGQKLDAKPQVDNHAGSLGATVNWNLGAVKLTSITGYQDFRRQELGDWDATPVNNSDVFWKDRARIFSQEVRVASNQPGALNWVAGAYYADEKLHEDWYTDFTRDFGVITRTKYKQDGRTGAVFGQADYALAPGLKGLVGLRQEHETRTVRDFGTTTTPPVAFAQVAGERESLTSNDTSGKIGLEYVPARGNLLYASISHGTKSGGISAHNTFNAFALTPFQPERLTSYEAGFKSDIGTALRVNGAVFHYDYRDQQFQDVTTGPSGALIGKIINIPKSRVDGGELELQWVPAAGLGIGQSLGYKHAVFKTFDSPLLGNLSGKDQFLPKLSYGGDVAYAWTAGEWLLKTAVDYSYHDKYPSWLNLLNPDGGHVYDIKPYWLADARFEVSRADSPWQVSLWAHNLFNKQCDLTRNFFGNRSGGTLDDLNVAAAGEGRTAGVVVSYAFR